MDSYRERLEAAVTRTRSLLCVGIDPSDSALEAAGAIPRASALTAAQRADACEEFGVTLVAAAAGLAPAVKPQMACFERAGWRGMRALERVCAAARAQGLLVILDGKRGDIPHSAREYVQAYCAQDAGIPCDALTINASLGIDMLEEVAPLAHSSHAMLYVLVRTSNPGAAELQPPGVWQRIAAAVERHGLGAVVGATASDEFAAISEHLPTAPLLMPGVGSQGGSIERLADLFSRPGAAPILVNVSRSIWGDLPSFDIPQLEARITGFSRQLEPALQKALWV